MRGYLRRGEVGEGEVRQKRRKMGPYPCRHRVRVCESRYFCEWWTYRGISLIRNSVPLRPYIRTLPRGVWWS